MACQIFSCSMWTPSCDTWNLVPWPGIQPRPLALEAQSPSPGSPGKLSHIVKWWYVTSGARTWKITVASTSLLQFPGGLVGLGLGAFIATAQVQFPVMEVAFRALLMVQQVKNPPTMKETQKTWVRFMGREDPLDEGIATHSIILARRIPQTEEPGELQSRGHKELDTTECLSVHLSII